MILGFRLTRPFRLFCLGMAMLGVGLILWGNGKWYAGLFMGPGVWVMGIAWYFGREKGDA